MVARVKKLSHIKAYLDLQTKLQSLIWQANDKIWKACTFTIGQQRLRSFEVIWRKLHVDKEQIEGVDFFMTADWSKAESVSLTSLQTCLCGKYFFTDKLLCTESKSGNETLNYESVVCIQLRDEDVQKY